MAFISISKYTIIFLCYFQVSHMPSGDRVKEGLMARVWPREIPGLSFLLWTHRPRTPARADTPPVRQKVQVPQNIGHNAITKLNAKQWMPNKLTKENFQEIINRLGQSWDPWYYTSHSKTNSGSSLVFNWPCLCAS